MRSLQRTVIFGATSAIAHATARRLVAAGASVHCIARNGARLDALLQDLRVRAGAEGPYIGGECADLDDYDLHAGLLARATRRWAASTPCWWPTAACPTSKPAPPPCR